MPSGADTSLKILIDADGRPSVAEIGRVRQSVESLAALTVPTGNAFSDLTGKIIGIGAGAVAVNQIGGAMLEVVRAADAWKLLAGQIGAANTHLTDSSARLDEVADAALRTNTALGSTAQLYTSLERSSQVSNANAGTAARLSAENLKIAEGINNALRVNGTSASAASGALIQLGQAFESGVLRGEEFNSVNEQAPRILDAVAREVGITKGELRKYAEQGQLTAEVVRSAILGMADEWAEAAAKMPTTFDQGLENLTTRFQQWAGTSAQVAGISEKLGAALTGVANNIDTLASVGGDLAIVAIAKAMQSAVERGTAWVGATVEQSAAAREGALANREAAEAAVTKTTADRESAAAAHAAAVANREEALAFTGVAATSAAVAQAERTAARESMARAEAMVAAAQASKVAAETEILRLGSIEGLTLKEADAAAWEARLTAAREQLTFVTRDLAAANLQLQIETEKVSAADTVAAEAQRRLTGAREAGLVADKSARVTREGLAGATTRAATAELAHADLLKKQAESWRDLLSVGNAVNAALTAWIAIDIGKWMREAADGATAWYNPLTSVNQGLHGLDTAMQSVSETYRQFRTVESEHADRLARESALLKKVSEQSGVTIASMKQLDEAVKAGTIVLNQSTGAWEKGTAALRTHATGLGAVDTAYAKAAQTLADFGKQRQAAAKASDAQTKASIDQAKAAGDEAGALKLAADAKTAAVGQANEALALSRAELATSETRLATLAKQQVAEGPATKAREDQIRTLTEEVLTRRNAVIEAEAQVTAAKAGAAAAQLESDTYGDQSAQLSTLIERRARLTDALAAGRKASEEGQRSTALLADAERTARQTAEAYTAVLAGQAQGDLPALAAAANAAQRVVTDLKQSVAAGAAADQAAAGLRERLTQTTRRLADAAADAMQQQSLLIARIQGEAQVRAGSIDLQVADLARRQQMAEALGNESEAREYAVDIQRKELEIAKLTAAAKAEESVALAEQARLLQLAAEADNNYTLAEQAQVQQAQLAARLAEIEAQKLGIATDAKRDAIDITLEFDRRQQVLAETFKAAGADQVQSIEDVRQAIQAAAEGPELDAMGRALEEAYARGVVSAEQYQSALDAIKAKQDGLSSGGGSGSTASGTQSSRSGTTTAGRSRSGGGEVVTWSAPAERTGNSARAVQAAGLRTAQADALATARETIAALEARVASMRPLRIPYDLTPTGADAVAITAHARGSRS